jgi:hypothetical protein
MLHIHIEYALWNGSKTEKHKHFYKKIIFSGVSTFLYLDHLYGLTASFPEKGKEQLNYTCETQSCISSYENFLFQLFSSPPNLAFSLLPLLFHDMPAGIVTSIRPQLLYIAPFPIQFIAASLSVDAIRNTL